MSFEIQGEQQASSDNWILDFDLKRKVSSGYQIKVFQNLENIWNDNVYTGLDMTFCSRSK